MKEDTERPVALGFAVTKPDILAEVERGEEAAAAVAGRYGEHQSPRSHTTPAGPSQGNWRGKEVKREEGVSPPPGSPLACHTGPANFPILLREQGCNYCGILEPELNPGASNGGFIAPSPTLESHRCRPGELLPLDCTECGRGFGPKPDLVRHRLARGGERGYTCGGCGTGFDEAVEFGTSSGPRRPAPCAGRSAGLAEGGPAAPRKERKELSLMEKVRVLEMLEGPKVSQSELAKRFGVSQPQICRIIKNKERILNEWHRSGDPERKRKREGKDVALEAALLRWVEGASAADLPSSGSLLCLKAERLAEVPGQLHAEPGSSRLAHFEVRHNLTFKKPPAEKGDAEQPTAEHWASTVLPGLLRSYAPAEIYTCGETGVLLPVSSPGKGESAGSRLTLILCTNADGSEKALLWAVGENPRPHCLQGVNLGQMPWSYCTGSLGGMTASLFTEWLREFDEGMRRQGKSVLLLLAKHEAHPYLKLSNVRMVFVPPATALTLPLDHGIAGDLKGHYQCRLLRWQLAERGVGQPTLLDVLHMLAQAWGDVRPGLIASCFRIAGISPDAGAKPPVPSQEQLECRTPTDKELERNGEPAEEDEGTVEGEDAGQPAAVQPCPSEQEVWGSLATLRRYLECRATSPDLFQAFYELEDTVYMLSASARRALARDTPPMQ